MDKATFQVVRFSEQEIIATSGPLVCTITGIDEISGNFEIRVGNKEPVTGLSASDANSAEARELINTSYGKNYTGNHQITFASGSSTATLKKIISNEGSNNSFGNYNGDYLWDNDSRKFQRQ